MLVLGGIPVVQVAVSEQSETASPTERRVARLVVEGDVGGFRDHRHHRSEEDRQEQQCRHAPEDHRPTVSLSEPMTVNPVRWARVGDHSLPSAPARPTGGRSSLSPLKITTNEAPMSAAIAAHSEACPEKVRIVNAPFTDNERAMF